MKKTQLTIDGRVFTLKGYIPYDQISRGLELSQCYDRPSATKKEIWQDWKTWALNNAEWMDVASFNTNMFTLKGVLQFKGVRYYYYITKTRQELFEIEY